MRRSYRNSWTCRLAAIIVLTTVIPATAAERARDLAEIVAGEHAWGHAFVTGDAAAAGKLLAQDFIGIDPRGQRYDKAAALRDIATPPHLTADTVGPVAVRFYGNTAIAQANETNIGPAPGRKRTELAFTDTWVKIGERWQIVAAEDLVIPR